MQSRLLRNKEVRTEGRTHGCDRGCGSQTCSRMEADPGLEGADGRGEFSSCSQAVSMEERGKAAVGGDREKL